MTDILTDRSDCHSLERLLRRRRSSFFPHSLHFLPDVRPDEFGDVLRQNGKHQLLFLLLLVFQFDRRFDAPAPVKKRPSQRRLIEAFGENADGISGHVERHVGHEHGPVEFEEADVQEEYGGQPA